ncbi:hypothetical protein C0995_011629, partial [Termitomyces sp. Mi166
AREADGKPPLKHVFAEMARVNLIDMRLGPEKHLGGRVLMDGIVTLEEFVESLLFVRKWITNAMFADYFSVASKTKCGGITVLVILRGDGVKTAPIPTSYSGTTGPAYATFDNLHDSFENIVGIAEKGLQVV